MEVIEYVGPTGRSPFGDWFEGLAAQPAARIRTALARLEQGNLSNAKSVGSGVLEYRLDAGPGYRIYFGRDGDTIIILLAGGTKRRQERDIEAARKRWADYKARRKG